MIIYNVTTQVSWEIHEEWKQWMLHEHVPALIATGIFSHHQFVRLLEVEEEDGPTYALQLFVKPGSSIDEYKDKHLAYFEDNELTRWGDRALSFSSLMEVIN